MAQPQKTDLSSTTTTTTTSSAGAAGVVKGETYGPVSRPWIQEWHMWSGTKSNIYCKGTCLSGPDRAYFYYSCGFIFIPFALYTARVLPPILMDLITDHYIYFQVLFVLVWLCLASLCLSNLFRCAYMDPGIVPRNTTYLSELRANPFRSPPAVKNTTVRGQIQQLKFCDTCYIYRPPKVIHCAECDNCVADFDHHCPWVGNCVSKRNYRHFLLFVIFLMVGIVWVFGTSLWLLIAKFIDYGEQTTSSPASFSNETSDAGETDVTKSWSFGDGILGLLKHFPDVIILALFVLAALGPVGSLGVFHMWLVSNRLSTNENIKGLHYITRRKGKSQTLFALQNWWRVLFGPNYPSFIRIQPDAHIAEISADRNATTAVVEETHYDVSVVVMPQPKPTKIATQPR